MGSARKDLITWRQLSPIFADVVLSPWNLLVGGLLIKYLSFQYALLSVLFGYAVLAIVFILYGGLGFKKRQQSAAILQEIFPGNFSKVFIPLVLAAGQLGWAAINISLGGTSFAALAHLPTLVGILLYAIVLAVMASMNLYRLAIVKMAVIASSFSLLLYLAAAKAATHPVLSFFSFQPQQQKSLFWGCSVVVASLISFATVSPDFFQSVKTRQDVVRSTLAGIALPGVVICMAGCFLFYNVTRLNLVALISGLSFAVLPQLFNTVANTDGSMALYTPALKFQALFRAKMTVGVIGGALISMTVAAIGITNYLQQWLKVLSIISPIFIGVAFAAVLFNHALPDINPNRFARLTYAATTSLCVLAIHATVPVLFALVVPLIIYAVFIHYRLLRE